MGYLRPLVAGNPCFVCFVFCITGKLAAAGTAFLDHCLGVGEDRLSNQRGKQRGSLNCGKTVVKQILGAVVAGL